MNVKGVHKKLEIFHSFSRFFPKLIINQFFLYSTQLIKTHAYKHSNTIWTLQVQKKWEKLKKKGKTF
mgnify:FL=1